MVSYRNVVNCYEVAALAVKNSKVACSGVRTMF